MTLASDSPDFLIVGDGSAGCALASRLSKDPATRVMPCEAGRDAAPSSIPSVLAPAYPRRTYVQREWLWASLRARNGMRDCASATLR